MKGGEGGEEEASGVGGKTEARRERWESKSENEWVNEATPHRRHGTIDE